LIDFLIENGCNVNVQTKRGETALHYAVRLGRQDVVAMLVCAGADIAIKGDGQKTPLEIAIEGTNADITNYLNKVFELNEWLRSADASETVHFCIAQNKFKSDIGCMESRDFRRLLLQLEGEFGPKLSRNEKLMSAYRVLRENMQHRITREEALNHQIHLVDSDKITIKTSITQIITENRQPGKRQSRSSSDESTRRTSDQRKTKTNEKNQSREDTDSEASSASETEEDASEEEKATEDWYINHTDLEFTKKLASGASGKVYKGLYRNQPVAIKVLYSDMGDEAVKELIEEIKVMSLFDQSTPDIVRFYGVCLEPSICIVMEYCAKGSLYEYLNDPTTKVTWAQFLDFARQMTRGLHRLHSAKPLIIHRDIKTKNILLTDNWQIKIADFGLARADTQTNKSVLGKMCGTTGYCAPELFYGISSSSKSDVYSLAIVFWEIIHRLSTGKYLKPYQEYDYIHLELQILYQAAEAGLRPTLPKNCPEIISDLVNRCWHAEPRERPSCAEILNILDEANEQFKLNPDKWAI
jgi:tRNA A-37 threonylcarbamoyl transferase component Bud32